MNPSSHPEIAVQVEFACQQVSLDGNADSSGDTSNIRSLLLEIQHGLKQFDINGHKRIIDLGGIPLAASERNKLLQLLGQGEIHINLSSLGNSEIYETLFSGVWVVKHRDEQEQISAMFIEICKIPDIVMSQMDDISELTAELQQLIDAL